MQQKDFVWWGSPWSHWALEHCPSEIPTGWAFLVALCHFLLPSLLYKSGPLFFKAMFLYFSSSYCLPVSLHANYISMCTDSTFCFIIIYWPWRWKQYINPKHQWTSTSLHDDTFQKITLQSHCCENLKSNSHRKWLKVSQNYSRGGKYKRPRMPNETMDTGCLFSFCIYHLYL